MTQIFDQEAVVASGDEAIAAGDDATFVDSEVDVTVGDVSVGNTTKTAASTTPAEWSRPRAMTLSRPATRRPTRMPPPRWARRSRAPSTRRWTPVRKPSRRPPAPEPEPAPEPVSEPAADLSADLTSSADTYESDDAGMVVEEAYVEEPTEEQ